MEPQMFALVVADDPRAIFCLGVDTGEEAVTFREGGRPFCSSTSMYSAFKLAMRLVGNEVRLALVIYKSEEAKVVQYKEGVCLACNNERKLSVALDDIFPPDLAAALDDTIPCPECTDEHGNLRQGVR